MQGNRKVMSSDGCLEIIEASTKSGGPPPPLPPPSAAFLSSNSAACNFIYESQERLSTEEWLAVAMAAVGTLGLGVSSEDPPAADPLTPPPPPSSFGFGSFLSLAVFLAVLGAAVVYGSRLTTAQKRKSASGAKTAASVHGLQVGGFFV